MTETLRYIPRLAFVVKYLYFRKIDAIIVQFKLAFVIWPEVWMQYHIAIIGYNKGVAIHAEFIWQRKFANVINQHVCASNAE